MNWFKFYGQEFLTDPKMMSLTAIEKSLWITLLCLASQNDGVIDHIDQYKVMVLTGISPIDDEWENEPYFFETFEKLGMITIDNEKVTLLNYNKRQKSNLDNSERQAKYRQKYKEDKENETNNNVTQRYESNAREEKRRIDKKREIENSLNFLLNIPEEVLVDFSTKYSCSNKQVKSKGEDLYNYCKSKNKKYADYKALLRNAIKKDFGERVGTSNGLDVINQKQKEWEDEMKEQIFKN